MNGLWALWLQTTRPVLGGFEALSDFTSKKNQNSSEVIVELDCVSVPCSLQSLRRCTEANHALHD